MRVILLQDVKNVGERDEVREVKDGYARNFLIPKGLARRATSEELKKLKTREQESTKTLKHLEELVRTMEERKLEFTLKTDEQGSVFGSVAKDDILKALREHRFVGKERVRVELDHPIKELGEHKITARFREGIEATVTIVVFPEKS